MHARRPNISNISTLFPPISTKFDKMWKLMNQTNVPNITEKSFAAYGINNKIKTWILTAILIDIHDSVFLEKKVTITFCLYAGVSENQCNVFFKVCNGRPLRSSLASEWVIDSQPFIKILQLLLNYKI